MSTFRTKKTYDAYEAHKNAGMLEQSCPLCKENSIQEFVYWRVIPNNFPYDRIAKKHDMLVPKRHVKETDLTQEEKEELLRIKQDSLHEYFYIVEAHQKQKSIPEHFHLHLLIPKDVI
jgi:hypothetical protein